jgi:hypothetical protein
MTADDELLAALSEEQAIPLGRIAIYCTANR